MADWNDPKARAMLESPLAPHETRGIMRMHRAGWPSQTIMDTFKMRGSKLISSFQEELDAEQMASDQGRAIHDALIEIPKEKS